ncbi:hypothetical protein [Caulobacter mirabilis]|uniref:Uncharacterized protein n=1 Tax=Caulobacter mirabilis TaxID=69666 RepID=A0A2D2AZ54_9CAUL|nr:hypothetical protein [Caulobacter mirabilis]ATQ43217.1 hypothetical protein CSW64_12720 [Caulobacter mirabilis]
MASNVYISNSGVDQLDLAWSTLGPSGAFNDNFSLGATVVPAGAGLTQVMSVDRSPNFGVLASPTMGELALTAGGVWIGSLVLMLDPGGKPIKNTLNWGLRGPGRGMSVLASDRNPHAVHFTVSGQRVTLSISGVSSGVFDDIQLDVRITSEPIWTKVQAAHDSNQNRFVVLALDGGHHPQLFQSPFSDTPRFQPLSASPPTDDRLAHAVLIENDVDSSQAIWAAGCTHGGKLWLQRTDTSTSSLLDLGLPAPTRPITAMTASDAFTVNGVLTADIFLCLQNPDQTTSLAHRQLSLGATPAFVGDWNDWGQILSKKASYCRSRNGRFVFVARIAGLRSQANINYCTASASAVDYGWWNGTADLPAGITTNKVLALQWGPKSTVNDDIALAWRGSNSALWAGSNNDSPKYGWKASTNSQLDGDEMTFVEGSNEVPILYRDPQSRQVRFARYMVKEAAFTGSGSLGPATPACFTGFATGDTQYALWQDPSTLNPTFVAIPR